MRPLQVRVPPPEPIRTWYKGCALVSKARDVGSIPAVRAIRIDLRLGCNSVAKHFIRNTLKPAMISPRIQRAIINGHEPDGLTLAKIRDLENS